MKFNVNNIKERAVEVDKGAAEFHNGEIREIKTSLLFPSAINPFNENDDDEVIKRLADNIKASKLINPIAVKKVSEDRYEILSGERRYKAITKYLKWEKVKCTVYGNISDAEAKLIMYSANLETREYSSAQKLNFYQDVVNIVTEMNGDLGNREKQQAIAEILKVSDRQVRKYQSIVDNLSEDNIEKIKSGEMSINEAVDKANKKSPEEVLLNKLNALTKYVVKMDTEKFDVEKINQVYTIIQEAIKVVKE